jgi:hypothetical protein
MSSAKRRLKTSQVDSSPFTPFTFDQPNLVPQNNLLDSGSCDFIRYDFPRKSAARIMVVARLNFGSIRTELYFAVEEGGGIVPITFIVGPVDSPERPMNQIPRIKADVLMQKEPKGSYRVKIELDRAVYFRVDPKHLLNHTLTRQPHQIGIFAAEKFLSQLSERIQGSPPNLRIASFGIKLKEQIEILESESKSNNLGPIDFSYYKDIVKHTKPTPVWIKLGKWIMAAAILFLLFKVGNWVCHDLFEPLIWLLKRLYWFFLPGGPCGPSTD